jgi:hypothetical protein
MAGCDYYSCDICGKKTFYDANLNYDEENKLIGVGYIKVICIECAKTNKVIIINEITKNEY